MAEISSILPFAINFTLVVVLLFVLARKPLRKMVYQRHEHLKDFVEASAQELARSRERMAQADERLLGAENESREIVAREAAGAARDVEAVLAAANRELGRLESESANMAVAMALDADDQIRARFVDLILADAGARLRTELRKDDHGEIMRRAENSIGAGV